MIRLEISDNSNSDVRRKIFGDCQVNDRRGITGEVSKTWRKVRREIRIISKKVKESSTIVVGGGTVPGSMPGIHVPSDKTTIGVIEEC